ncbi:S41 family peptidase [Candidatus Parcubacteria bacterium]|nr:S41 family peptidase [Candidatus Parcubacteria bacterium]
MSSFSKRFAAVVIGAALAASSFIAGAYYGTRQSFALEDFTGGISNKELAKPNGVDFAPFWQAWNILNDRYVPTKKSASTTPTTDQAKVWGAIKGLAEAYGDPYTTFFPPQEASDFKAEISGAFEGVGMEVAIKDNILTVVAPLKNTPAQKAGLKPGDRILKINDSITAKLSVEEAIRLMRGKKGTEVRLTILSAEAKQPKEVKIVRDTISIPTLDTEKRADGIFVIKLYNFSANSANLFRNALEEFARSGSNRLVLDLRGNPGGYLDAALDMASWFLPKEQIVLREDLGDGKEEIHYSKGYDIFNNNLKMVILVDGGSASASEILAGALQEHGIASLVGATTFGKGSVQELVNLTPETALKITIARWLTPKGNSISEQGLKPDVEVKVTEEDVKNQVDAQMNKAVELLKAR